MMDTNDRFPARQALSEPNSSARSMPWVSMPLANAVVVPGAVGIPEGAEVSTEDETLAIDLSLLAERILALMRREAIIDRERSGWMR